MSDIETRLKELENAIQTNDIPLALRDKNMPQPSNADIAIGLELCRKILEADINIYLHRTKTIRYLGRKLSAKTQADGKISVTFDYKYRRLAFVVKDNGDIHVIFLGGDSLWSGTWKLNELPLQSALDWCMNKKSRTPNESDKNTSDTKIFEEQPKTEQEKPGWFKKAMQWLKTASP